MGANVMTTTPQAALLSEAAQNALTTLDGIANANPRDKTDFDTPDEWIAWAKSRARWAADALREPVAQEVYAERILKQMLHEDSKATQAEPPKDVSMPQYWSVDVFSDGAKIVSIGNDWLSGERPLDEIDERTIIGAAQHLLSFVGYGLPPTSFDPDAQAEPVQAGELPDERAAFEAEMRCSEEWGHRSLKKRTNGKYENWQVDLMWDVWQARAALAARKPLSDDDVAHDALAVMADLLKLRDTMGRLTAQITSVAEKQATRFVQAHGVEAVTTTMGRS